MERRKLKKPFFVSFLEKQVKEPDNIKGGYVFTSAFQENAATRPGNDHFTMKYPSDNDEVFDS